MVVLPRLVAKLVALEAHLWTVPRPLGAEADRVARGGVWLPPAFSHIRARRAGLAGEPGRGRGAGTFAKDLRWSGVDRGPALRRRALRRLLGGGPPRLLPHDVAHHLEDLPGTIHPDPASGCSELDTQVYVAVFV